jgi:hypothetical protein
MYFAGNGFVMKRPIRFTLTTIGYTYVAHWRVRSLINKDRRFSFDRCKRRFSVAVMTISDDGMIIHKQPA